MLNPPEFLGGVVRGEIPRPGFASREVAARPVPSSRRVVPSLITALLLCFPLCGLASLRDPIALFASAATPKPESFLELWITLGFMASIAANIFTVVRVSKTQKREITFSFDPASKEDFDRHVVENKREHEQLFSRINAVDRAITARQIELDAKNEQRVTALHNRVNEVLEAVSELRGEVRNIYCVDHRPRP